MASILSHSFQMDELILDHFLFKATKNNSAFRLHNTQNKFSNCFVRVSISTSDLKFLFSGMNIYKRRTPDKDFRVKRYEISNAAVVLTWR